MLRQLTRKSRKRWSRGDGGGGRMTTIGCWRMQLLGAGSQAASTTTCNVAVTKILHICFQILNGTLCLVKVECSFWLANSPNLEPWWCHNSCLNLKMLLMVLWQFHQLYTRNIIAIISPHWPPRRWFTGVPKFWNSPVVHYFVELEVLFLCCGTQLAQFSN